MLTGHLFFQVASSKVLFHSQQLTSHWNFAEVKKAAIAAEFKKTALGV